MPPRTTIASMLQSLLASGSASESSGTARRRGVRRTPAQVRPTDLTALTGMNAAPARSWDDDVADMMYQARIQARERPDPYWNLDPNTGGAPLPPARTPSPRRGGSATPANIFRAAGYR